MVPLATPQRAALSRTAAVAPERPPSVTRRTRPRVVLMDIRIPVMDALREPAHGQDPCQPDPLHAARPRPGPAGLAGLREPSRRSRHVTDRQTSPSEQLVVMRVIPFTTTG